MLLNFPNVGNFCAFLRQYLYLLALTLQAFLGWDAYVVVPKCATWIIWRRFEQRFPSFINLDISHLFYRIWRYSLGTSGRRQSTKRVLLHCTSPAIFFALKEYSPMRGRPRLCFLALHSFLSSLGPIKRAFVTWTCSDVMTWIKWFINITVQPANRRQFVNCHWMTVNIASKL